MVLVVPYELVKVHVLELDLPRVGLVEAIGHNVAVRLDPRVPGGWARDLERRLQLIQALALDARSALAYGRAAKDLGHAEREGLIRVRRAVVVGRRQLAEALPARAQRKVRQVLHRDVGEGRAGAPVVLVRPLRVGPVGRVH